MLILLLSLGNLGTASYQFGIQLGIFPDMCAVVSPATLHDFKSMLFRKQHAFDSCSSITLVFGLPVVVWSMLSSLGCLFALAKNLRTKRKHMNEILGQSFSLYASIQCMFLYKTGLFNG